MNCTCIHDIEKKFVGFEFGDKKNKVIKAEFISAALMFGENSLTTVTNSEVLLTVERAKRPKVQSIMHSFCPFCGVKISKTKTV